MALTIIGEHKITPSDAGLIESLRLRGYEVAFQDDPELQQIDKQEIKQHGITQ